MVRDSLLKLRHDPFMFVSDGAGGSRVGGGLGSALGQLCSALCFFEFAKQPCRCKLLSGNPWQGRLTLLLPHPPLFNHPHPQHQANLAVLDASGKSLVMRWVDAVVDLYSSLVAWPLRSLGLDDLFAQYKAREARDACALSYTLEVAADGGVGAVSVSSGSGGSCSAPLMTGAGTSSIAVSGGAGRVVTSLVWGKPGAAA